MLQTVARTQALSVFPSRIRRLPKCISMRNHASVALGLARLAFYPGLALWAAFLRRSAALSNTLYFLAGN